MTEVQKRFATAGVVIPILLVFFWLGGIWFFGLVELVIVIGCWEFYRMIEAKGLKAQSLIGTVFALSFPVLFYWKMNEPMLVLMVMALFFLIVLSRQLFQKDILGALTTTGSTLLGVFYVGFLLSHILLLRNWSGKQGRVDFGFFLIVLVIAITFLSDTGGFLIGRKWGKHKLSPRISPKKSWEGAVGSLIFGVAGAVLTKLIFDRWILETGFEMIHCVILGALLVVSAMFGDSVESLFKRDAGIKDSGTIVPGHGGILDRLDSIVFTVPVCYYYLKLFG